MPDILPAGPSLAEFIEQIEQRLPTRDATAVLDALRAVAAHVPIASRRAALDQIPSATAPTDPELVFRDYVALPEVGEGSDLVAASDDFVRRLEEGHYFQTIDWDDEVGEERAWGDESWAREMDELFGRAATAYLSGNHALAARVYGRLLATLRHAARRGIFCGRQAPTLMIQTDVNEAKRRHLRSLYRITSAEHRPERLLAELELLREVGDAEVSLRTLFDTEPDGDQPLAEVETFLPAWVALLRTVPPDSGYSRESRRLLREAVELLDGVDGLAELARSSGTDHPEAWHEWVGLLVRLDRVPEALDAARDGCSRIRDPMYRARLADRLAALAATVDDPALALQAARTAWRSQPTEVRLLHLVAAAERADAWPRAGELEAGMVLRPDWRHSDALACRLLLLVGRIEEATTRFQRADALGWGRPDHAGSIVLPFLLLASTDADIPPAGTAIAGLWLALDDVKRNYFDRRLLLDRMSSGGAALEPSKSYSAMLLTAVQTHRIPTAYRQRTLNVAQLKVEAATRDILNGQHRRGHQLAAELTTAVAETLILAEGEAAGMRFFRNTRKRFVRYRTFVEALEQARDASPLLPCPTNRDERAALRAARAAPMDYAHLPVGELVDDPA